MRHQAIYNTHPNVTRIVDGVGAFDKDGKPVHINEAAVTAAMSRMPVPVATVKQTYTEHPRKAFYDANGLTLDRYVTAMIQRDIDGDTSAMDAFVKERAALRKRGDLPPK